MVQNNNIQCSKVVTSVSVPEVCLAHSPVCFRGRLVTWCLRKLLTQQYVSDGYTRIQFKADRDTGHGTIYALLVTAVLQNGLSINDALNTRLQHTVAIAMVQLTAYICVYMCIYIYTSA